MDDAILDLAKMQSDYQAGLEALVKSLVSDIADTAKLVKATSEKTEVLMELLFKK